MPLDPKRLRGREHPLRRRLARGRRGHHDHHDDAAAPPRAGRRRPPAPPRRPRSTIPCDNDGVTEGLEQCDDGNIVDEDDCDDCRINVCGDGVPDRQGPVTEECDDGNGNDSDGCTSACTVCGNRTITPPETCDDGNLANDDFCPERLQGRLLPAGHQPPARDGPDHQPERRRAHDVPRLPGGEGRSAGRRRRHPAGHRRGTGYGHDPGLRLRSCAAAGDLRRLQLRHHRSGDRHLQPLRALAVPDGRRVHLPARGRSQRRELRAGPRCGVLRRGAAAGEPVRRRRRRPGRGLRRRQRQQRRRLPHDVQAEHLRRRLPRSAGAGHRRVRRRQHQPERRLHRQLHDLRRPRDHGAGDLRRRQPGGRGLLSERLPRRLLPADTGGVHGHHRAQHARRGGADGVHGLP